MSKIRIIVNSLIIITFTSLSAYASNYADTFGASPMGVALGGAMTGRVNDWSSIYYNIAGLGKTVDSNDIVSEKDKEFKNQFAAAYILNMPQFDINISRYRMVEDVNTGVQTQEALATDGDDDLQTGTFVIGGALDLNLFYKMPAYISSARLGLLVSLNDDLTLVKINDTSLKTHTFFRYGRDTQSLMLLIGAGFGLLDDLIGFGMGTAQSMGGTGRIVARDLALDTDKQAPEMETKFDFEIARMPLILGGYIKPGRIVPMLEGLDLGIAYRQESYLYVDDFLMHTIVDSGNIEMMLGAEMFDFYQPPITRVGASYTTDHFIASADLEYRQWSKFRVSDASELNYKDSTQDTTDETADEDTETEETADTTGTTATLIPIPDLDDIIIPRFGLQINVSETAALLMGYYFEKSCVPDSETKGIYNLLDNDKHVGSCGLKFRVPKTYNIPVVGHLLEGIVAGFQGPIDVTATYQYQHLVKRDVTKTDPTLENPKYSYDGACHTVMAGVVMNL